MDPDIYSISICASAQIGKSLFAFAVLGYHTDQEPIPILVVLADEDTAKAMSNKRWRPMFEDSEYLSRLIEPNEWTTTQRGYINGLSTTFAWASSAARLASFSYGFCYADEIDKDGYVLTSREAPALTLIEERMSTYHGAKFLKTSTPTDENGNITKELEKADAVYDWHVPCPHCGQFQPLRWSTEHCYGFKDGQYRSVDGTMHDFGEVIWEGGREATNEQITTTCRYKCGECGGLGTTNEKNEAVRDGQFVPREPETGYERNLAFHINRIYSLFSGGRLENLVSSWVNIWRIANREEQNKTLQGFINSTLAEPWVQKIRASSENEILMARCDLPPQTVPENAVVLTAFIDPQKYNFWFRVRAHARDYTSWLIHWGSLATWEDVERLLFDTEYPVQGSDRSMRIWRAAIDTGGTKNDEDYDVSMTERAYEWLRRNMVGRGCRVWGTKGSSSSLGSKLALGKALDQTPSGKSMPPIPGIGGLQLVMIDTDKAKDSFHYRLRLAFEQLPGGAYLHEGTHEDYRQYVSHITAEEKRRDRRGVEEWVKIRPRNDLFDCEANGALLVDPEWPGGGVNLIRKPTEGRPTEQPPAQKRNTKEPAKNWLGDSRKNSNWFRR
jgi:phage terminase large subunit GpA-like protein